MDSSATLAVETSGLTKRFGKVEAVRGIDLAIRRGSIYAVLGPNGAGKTTTLRMLGTLIAPDAGTARVLGFDVVTEADAVRERICLTGQFASIDEDLTGMENMVVLGMLLGYSRRGAKARGRELLDAFGLSEAADRQVKDFSGGMRRRIDIAASIIVTPELLFLDEPTTGLDPRSRNQVWEIVRTLVRDGTTVLLTTQYLEEADQLADRIAVIDKGEVIAEGTSAELKAEVGAGVVHVRVADPAEANRAQEILAAELGVEVQHEADQGRLVARLDDQQRVAAALGALAGQGIAIASFSLGQPSLDEVFFALTGHGTEEEPAEEATQ